MAQSAPTFGGASRTNPYAVGLWVLMLAWVARVTIFIRQRSSADFAAVDAAATIQILITLTVLGLVLIHGRTVVLWQHTARLSLRMLVYYYLACLVSASWSLLPAYTAYRAVEYLAMVLGVALAVHLASNFAKAERTVVLVALLVTVLTVVGHAKLVGISFDIGRWHTNSYTASAAMLFVYCLGELFGNAERRRAMLIFCATFSFLALGLGTSTASNIATMAGVAVILFFAKSKKLLIWAVVISIILVPVALVVETDADAISRTLLGGKSTQDVVELDNRAHLWELLFAHYLDSPLIGSGFAVISTGRGGLSSASTHNSVLSVLLGTGLLGAFFLIGYLSRLARESLGPARARQPGSIGVAAALVAGIVNSLAMPMIMDEWEESSLVFVSFASLAVFWVYLPWRSEARARRIAARGIRQSHADAKTR